MNFWTYLKDFTESDYTYYVQYFDDLTESIGPFDKKHFKISWKCHSQGDFQDATYVKKYRLFLNPTWKIIVLPGYFPGLHHFLVMVVVQALRKCFFLISEYKDVVSEISIGRI